MRDLYSKNEEYRFWRVTYSTVPFSALTQPVVVWRYLKSMVGNKRYRELGGVWIQRMRTNYILV